VIATLLAVLGIIVVGGRATDGLRTAQVESILTRLPDAEARAYYAVLKRRLRKVAVLRALALLSLLVMFYVFRQRLGGHEPAAAPAPAPAPAPTQPVPVPAPSRAPGG
jgi:hypothetical protein